MGQVWDACFLLISVNGAPHWMPSHLRSVFETLHKCEALAKWPSDSLSPLHLQPLHGPSHVKYYTKCRVDKEESEEVQELLVSLLKLPTFTLSGEMLSVGWRNYNI